MTKPAPAISPLGSSTIPAFGELMQNYLVNKYPQFLKLKTIDDASSKYSEVKNAITELFTVLKLFKGNITSIDNIPVQTLDAGFKIGDILTFGEGAYQRIYLVTGVGGTIRTYPALVNDDAMFINPMFPSPVKTQRIGLAENLDQTTYENFVAQQLPDLIKTVNIDDACFSPRDLPKDTTSLQIGDLIFGVDPVQISFTTQNGYQIFPTVRSDGNPKLSTLQQIKNISVTLIFPNVDAINYQLLPLYAMFRRTPFVNIRNREISNFFRDLISNKTEWIPVGLESINIQSIDGFPNSVQADITFLPIDTTVLGGTAFKALLSMNDVAKQQNNLLVDRDQERAKQLQNLRNLDEPDSQSIKDLISEHIESSEDFRESAPFRAFYQSLIKDFSYVKNENGEDAKLKNKAADVTAPLYLRLDEYRPLKDENKLTIYLPEHNNSPVTLVYKYVNKEFASLSRELSKERLNKVQERISTITRYMENVKSHKDIINLYFPIFRNLENFTRAYQYEFRQADKMLSTLLAYHGWDVTEKTKKPILFIIDVLMHITDLGPLWETYQTAKSLAGKKLDVRGDLSEATSLSYDWLLSNKLLVTDVNSGHFSGFGFQSIEDACKAIFDSVKDDPKRKKELGLIIDELASRMVKTMTDSFVVTDSVATDDPTGFGVAKLPLEFEYVEIDNVNDVITGWNVTFTNKFVPFYFQANKYPFYQHLGFEDATLSLRIVSVPRAKKYDLKAELSKMSDRIQESNKIITFTAPELSIFLDPRVTIDSQPHSIFNALGINKVVINSTNTTNRQGQPDSWNTVINMTQAKYTVDQYHSIESKRNMTTIVRDLALLLPRLKLTPDGKKIEVRRYFLVNPETKQAEVDEKLIYLLSFYDSPAFSRVMDRVIKATDSTKNFSNRAVAEEIKQKVNALLADKSLWDNDATATAALQSVLENNPSIDRILKAVIRSYDDLLDKQADLFTSMFVNNKSLVESFFTAGSPTVNRLKSILNTNSLGLLIAGLIFTSIATASTAGTALIIAAGAFALSSIGLQTLVTTDEQVIQAVRNHAGHALSLLSDITKKEILIDLATKIAKDPGLRDKLLSYKIIYGDRGLINNGKDFMEGEYVIKDDEGFNCYTDFDIPPMIASSKNTKIRLSPDFYIHVKNIDKALRKEFIEAQKQQIIRINQASMQLSMMTRIDTLVRFYNLMQFVKPGDTTFSEPMLNKIKVMLGLQEQDGNQKILTSNEQLQKEVSKYLGTVLIGAKGDGKDSENLLITETKKQALKVQIDQILAAAKTENTLLGGPQLDQQREELYKLVDEYASATAPLITDRDALKLNFISAQRDLIIIELLEMFYAVSSYLNSNIQFKSEQKSGKQDKLYELFKQAEMNTLDGATKNSLKELRETIKFVLEECDNIQTSSLQKPSSPKYRSLASQFEKGAYKQKYDKAVSIPQIRLLESMLYNKIGYFIRLNTVIQEANKNLSRVSASSINLDSLPELKFLDYFNRRELESTFRKLRIAEAFEDSYNRELNLNTRMFPSFKILFVEEDGRQSVMDDYYAFNAVQSIEIVKNKNFASSTAVIRLSNVTGSLTDRLSLHREESDFYSSNPLGKQDTFFGTLDVKPGTKIIIKLGYGTSDKQLPTVFSGRVLEMNVGPVTEMICQSFGAQLKTEIYSDTINMWSGIKAHGDIASALLDKIPGLENFGSKKLFQLDILSPTSGRNLKNFRKNVFDRFILSNLLSRVDSDIAISDNPRDENIYLPYDLSTIVKWNPTFKWVIFQQSIWDALQELSLYNVNTEVIVKPYNNDGLSSRSEQRETIVIGQKSGYYKYTDAYSLTSLDYDSIEARINKFHLISPVLSTIADDKIVAPTSWNHDLMNPFRGTAENKIIPSPVVRLEGNVVEGQRLYLKSKWKPVWDFFQDRTHFVIMAKYLLSRIYLDTETLVSALVTYVDNFMISLGAKKPTYEEQAIEAMREFQSYGWNEDPVTSDLNKQASKLVAFEKMLIALGKLTTADPQIWDKVSADQFYDVRVIGDNSDPKLALDPRYKKIQKHHLISDSFNLLNNNIVLNNGFANMVNLYYFDEPLMADPNGLTTEQYKKINVLPIKAFRDIRDEYLRPINSFQKNIDTSFVDIAKTENIFKGKVGFSRISVADNKVKSELEKKMMEMYPEFSALKLDTPDWRALPTYWLVAANILKKEVQKMYRGTLRIVGDPSIEPMDIIHLDDALNDMQGACEVEEVIHTFTPDQGFTTTITPSLIVYDRDPLQIEDIAIVDRIFKAATNSKRVATTTMALGLTTTAAGVIATIAKSPITGLIVAGTGLGFAYNGLMGTTVGYHRFLHDAMIEVAGGDIINFTALIYKGMPFMCGFDGVDYTNLKTLINHKVDRIKNPITRFSAFWDPFSAWLYSGFDPSQYGLGGWFTTLLGLRKITTIGYSDVAKESIGFFDTVFRGFGGLSELKP